MYDSYFYYMNGKIKCESSFKGSYAAYLIKNGEVVEKQHYTKKKEKVFSWYGEGVYSVRFFFAINGERVKYLAKSFFIREKVKYLVDDTEYRSRNIAEGENFRILFFDNHAEVTFITFNGTRSRKKSLPFALKYCKKRNFNLISVNQDGDSQYQDLSLSIFHEAVRNYLTSSNINYGASLGGYCALYYAGVINANVIAISPKNSAHPKFIKKRFKGLNFKHKEIRDTPTSKGNVNIFFDPYKVEDVKFLEGLILPYSDNCKLHPLPHAGHQLLKYVKELGCLTELIDSLVINECIDIEENVENSTYLAEKAWFLYRDDNKEVAKEMALRSMDIAPNRRAEMLLSLF
ncbi:hypothetical protein [Vreelandella alkaliphila]|uniref:Uncharacterized protein n=1 Tax=Vreelandella alkaliphila TaxID=272774 RepID=A0AAJ2VPF2_9GAMM|nr:hypothetical protein [Halomonas alkaliphila]MDX5976679.1 hypothetical protein [Halomonas alkaliphila]